MVPIHPGRILRRELAAPAMSANRLALALRVPSGRITSILNGRRAISADTALRLARHLGTSAQFWLNLQTRYDLTVAERDHGAHIAADKLPLQPLLKEFGSGDSIYDLTTRNRRRTYRFFCHIIPRTTPQKIPPKELLRL